MKISKKELIRIVKEEVSNAFPVAEATPEVESSDKARLFFKIDEMPDGPELGNIIRRLISYMTNEQVLEMLDDEFSDDVSEL